MKRDSVSARRLIPKPCCSLYRGFSYLRDKILASLHQPEEAKTWKDTARQERNNAAD